MSGLLFSGGTIVSAEGSYRADVLVEDEKIVAVGTNLDTEDAETVDASGKLVMPGFIDAHTHMDMPFGGTVTAKWTTRPTRGWSFMAVRRRCTCVAGWFTRTAKSLASGARVSLSSGALRQQRDWRCGYDEPG